MANTKFLPEIDICDCRHSKCRTIYTSMFSHQELYPTGFCIFFAIQNYPATHTTSLKDTYFSPKLPKTFV